MDFLAPFFLQLIIIINLLIWLISWRLFLKKKTSNFTYTLVLGSFFIQFCYLIFFLFKADWSLPSQILFLCAFFINLSYVFLIRKTTTINWELIIPGFVCFILILAYLFSDYQSDFLNQQTANFKKILLWSHIILFILTYLILSIVFLTSLLLLFLHFKLRDKKPFLTENLPSLGRLYKISTTFSSVGFLSLSVFLFTSLWLQALPISDSNLFEMSFRIIAPALFWFVYGIFICIKTFFSFSNILEAWLSLVIYVVAIASLLYEFQFLF